MRYNFLIVVFLVCILPLHSQHVADLFDDLDNDSAVVDFKTPELSEFLDAALAYHAYHRMQDAQMRNFESQIKAKKREWMDHFYIDADTRYGLYNYILVTGNPNSPGISPSDNQYSYYVALSVRIPFSVFTKTKHEIRALQHTVDQHKAYQEQLDDELMRIAEIWVDAALRLESKDLRMMERLVMRQTGKVETAHAGDSVVLSA